MQALSLPNESSDFQMYVFHISSVKRFIAYDLVGGFAFYLLAKLFIGGELICIACNIVSTQMLKHVTLVELYS